MKYGHLNDSPANRLFYIINYIFMSFCLIVVLVPLLNLISQSLSSPASVYAGKILLWPVEPTLIGYKSILGNKNISNGFINSVIITFGGTCVSVLLTITAAYPLSRKSLFGRTFFTWLFTFTMLFNAGLIPNYLLVQSLGLIDSLWALMLPGAVSVWNVIIARTFFQTTIPEELYEAAYIDGASDFRVFGQIALPLSGPILAIMVLFYAVGIWNAYFDSLIYLQTQERFPLQLVLRNIMTSTRLQAGMVDSAAARDRSAELALVDVMKYAVIVVASLPLLMLYPFVQKYFVKGLMIGAVKG